MVDPLDNCVIRDWDDMNHVWHHAFTSSLKVDPQDHPVMLVLSPFNSATLHEVILLTKVHLEMHLAADHI